MNTVNLSGPGGPATAAEIIRSGGLVAVPTETVYGLAGNGLDKNAVEKIYRIKGRPELKPLSLLVSGEGDMERCWESVPASARVLAGKFWPGPLTMVMTSKAFIPDIVRGGGATVGLRCPDHPLTLELIEKAGVPLAAPSANPSGRPSPKNAEQVRAYFDGEIEAVMDGGECGIGFESTIIDLSVKPFTVLRQGALGVDEIISALRDSLCIIGITGGTGCGKTTALKTLESLGALILDSDSVYHELTCTSEPMRREIVERFGAVYDGGKLDRKKLGSIVFSDDNALLDLNRITHKYVDMELEARLRAFAMSGGRIAAIDAIGLLEAGFAKKTAFNVAVTAPTAARVERIMAREGISREYASMRVAAQHDNEYFEKNCDYVLVNDADIVSFENKCKKFFAEVLKNVRG